MSIINADNRNPENCFCQSQYCKFKKDNECVKYNKHIIGTAICEGYEENPNIDYFKNTR